jgi:hypothetical protein
VIPHLIGLLREDEPVEWTEDTFQQLAKTGKVYSYGLKQRQQSQHILRPTGQEGTNQSLHTQTGPETLVANSRNWLPQSGSTMQETPSHSTDFRPPRPPNQSNLQSQNNDQNDLQNDDQNDLPKPPRDISKALTDLTKLYSDDKLKFRGDKYQYLQIEIIIFYENYEKVGLQEVDYNRGFSSILRGRVREYYFERLARLRPRPDFRQMCEAI